MVCKYSTSFLNTSINSTNPLLPTLNAPFNENILGSSSGYMSILEISIDPVKIDVSWLLGSTGGTTPIPFLERIEKFFVETGNFSYSPPNSFNNLYLQTGHKSPSISTPNISSNSFLKCLGIKCSGSSCIGHPSKTYTGGAVSKTLLIDSTKEDLPAPTGPTKYNTCLASSPLIEAE